MSYGTRTKDNPGDVGRAADQQQGVDNEEALFAALLGPNPPAATGGIVRQFVKKTGIADNVATEVCTITTTNEAGSNDGGVYHCLIEGIACHGKGSTGDVSSTRLYGDWVRSMGAAGVGVNSTIQAWAFALADTNAGNKSMGSAVLTLVEVSEYVVSVRATLDLSGAVITTGEVYMNAQLIYAGFLTPPVITSAE